MWILTYIYLASKNEIVRILTFTNLIKLSKMKAELWHGCRKSLLLISFVFSMNHFFEFFVNIPDGIGLGINQ